MKPGIHQTWKLVQYIIGIRTEARQKINAVHCSRGIYCLFDYKALFACVKDRTCLRMAIRAYCFSIFGSIFGALFCLLIKKFILRCDTIWQSMRKFLWTIWSVSTFPHIDKEEISFLKAAYWYGLNFLYLFTRPKKMNLKISENLAALTFVREKVSTFAETKWYMYTLWLWITLCNMPKGLVT